MANTLGFAHTVISALLTMWACAYAWLVTTIFFGDRAARVAQLVADGRIQQGYADYILRIPTWIVALSAVLAALRVAGAATLWFRAPIAESLFALAMLITGVMMFRGFVLEGVASVIRPSQVLVEIAFIVISVFAWWYARRLASAQTW